MEYDITQFVIELEKDTNYTTTQINSILKILDKCKIIKRWKNETRN